MSVSDLLTRSNMPSSCTRCGAPISPSSRFCEQCGKPVELVLEKGTSVNIIPLLELHEGILDAGRTPVVMEVLAEELRVYRLPDNYAGEVEDLQNRLDEAYLDLPEETGNWNAILATWDWPSEPILCAVTGCREELAQEGNGPIVIRNGDIRSVTIERIESDTVWDLMTVDCSGKKLVFDLVGPIAQYTLVVIRGTLGEVVSAKEE